MGAWSYVKPRLQTALRELRHSGGGGGSSTDDEPHHHAAAFAQHQQRQGAAQSDLMVERAPGAGGGDGSRGLAAESGLPAVRYVGRASAASPATASFQIHQKEQQDIVEAAMAVG
jgi:2-oxoglutarate dehydrogenase complex dehydrogenase (E1) component-like enzyme